jgi:hypothetical protein
VRQSILAVEVFGLMAEWIDFSDQVALVIVPGLPDAAVRGGGFD